MSARYRLILTGEGVELSDCSMQDAVWNVKWNDISRILAWKQDCGTFDTICLGFCRRDEDEVLACDEDVEEWAELLNVLDRRFALDRDWWSKVACPAFEMNPTVIWTYEPSSDAAANERG
jgi:hypothetical protein